MADPLSGTSESVVDNFLEKLKDVKNLQGIYDYVPDGEGGVLHYSTVRPIEKIYLKAVISRDGATFSELKEAVESNG